MKAQPQPRKLNAKRKSGLPQTERLTIFDAQTASTSPSSEPAWIMVALALVLLTVGLYWFSDRPGDQPDRSVEAADADQSAGERPAAAVTGGQILSDPENRTRPWPEDLTSPPRPSGGRNERLVLRFYDEVLNRRQFALIDDLFADQVAYRRSGPTTMLSLAALKQQLQTDSAYYVGLYYSIDQVTTNGDWVHVDWSAEGTPLLSSTESPLTGEPQFWSGHTIWRVVDGQIVRMWTYTTKGRSQPLRSSVLPAPPPWPPGQLQDNQGVAAYPFHPSGSYSLP